MHKCRMDRRVQELVERKVKDTEKRHQVRDVPKCRSAPAST